jgi:hypothetical protein
MLSGRLGDRLEAWEMRRKLRKFQPQLSHSGGSAILTKDQVKGHFEDHGEYVHRTYQTRLREFCLTGTGCAGDPKPLIRADAQEPRPPDRLLVLG